ncbi:MAG: hypothetical protein FGM37_09510, partial [Phycisphaerales bacterium]|nr:hypothetical protein [Phycisphaerales bacterium]
MATRAWPARTSAVAIIAAACTAIPAAPASAGGSSMWTNYITDPDTGLNFVYRVFAEGGTVYAATDTGLAISTDGGSSWTNYNDELGSGTAVVRDVFVSGGTIYAATGLG